PIILTLLMSLLFKAYHLLRPLLFSMDAERAHHVTLAALNKAAHNPLFRKLYAVQPASMQTQLMGLPIRHPVGLAAGLDKNGEYIDALGGLGFGFIEVGTVTPLPQSGNPKPRMFRLPRTGAI